MADTVTSRVVFSNTNSRKYIVHLTGISDGTGESAVVKVDRSALTNGAGQAPDKIKIASIRWNIQGYSYIKLSWDHTADDTAMVLSGNGYDNFESYGCLVDPNTSGDTVTGAIGDLLLTSVGAASGASYDVTIEANI
jgi:hypothetical protein